ncbi:MAG: 3',5'-cyclic-nucleotide phosphodiesterase [Deltaproteobacteria bacterium]|nr:3',5'-cyclic-nucleotide phosphodiesterase [Deltaproteobacteria bacterium]MCL5792410.1 3',5'-cyclic-nucleotide phosphodiesterase [Deltaproteobacteria bacterium]
MNIRVLGCHGGELPNYRTTSFLINERIILDAGAITGVLTMEEQLNVEHIFITHSHADHSRDILFLADNVVGSNGKGFTIYGMPVVLKAIKQHLFNWHIWPDFTEIPTKDAPIVKMREIGARETIKLGGISFTACPVNHTVPASGFIMDDGESSVVFSSDTGSTDEIWNMASNKDNLKAVFIESSFPEDKRDLALLTKHLTPRMITEEIKKIGKRVAVYVYHIKPQFYDQVSGELGKIDPSIEVLKLNQIIKI